MYSNNIVNFQESTTILNACTKQVRKPIEFTTYAVGKTFFLLKHILDDMCWRKSADNATKM